MHSCTAYGCLHLRLSLPFPPHSLPPASLQAEVPAATHRLVALGLLETYVRYSRVAVVDMTGKQQKKMDV